MMTIRGQEQDPSSVDDDDDGCWVGLGKEKYWGAGNPSHRGAERYQCGEGFVWNYIYTKRVSILKV